MGWAEGFASGVHLGRSLIDTYDRAKQQGQLDEIANAKPEDATVQAPSMQGFKGAAPDASGATSQMDLADAPIAATGVTKFLGKTYDRPLTDDQVNNARLVASAGVLMRTNPTEAARLIQGVQQGERDNQRFAREQTSWGRQDAEYNKQQDYERGRSEAFAGTYYGRQTADYAKQLQQWQADKKAFDAAVAAGQTPPGPAPVQPQRPAYTIGQSLADEAALLAHDAKSGRLDRKQFVEFTERSRKIEQEGYGQALRLAQGGANLDAVAQAFNASGSEKFDPKMVISDRKVKNAQGVESREITYRTPDGQTHTINTLAELDALGQAQEVFTRHFKGREDDRAEKGLGIQQAQLGIAQQQLGIHGRQVDSQINVNNAQIKKLQAESEALKVKADGKPMPDSAAKGLLENQQTLRRATAALALISGGTADGVQGDANATGVKGMLPNQLLNRVDPSGVQTRAAIADLGSMVIHDRSGAAVTAAEMPRLQPFIPTETDSPEVAKKKLEGFVRVYSDIAADAVGFYKANGYKVPDQVLKQVEVTLPRQPGQQPPAAAVQPPALPNGWTVKVN